MCSHRQGEEEDVAGADTLERQSYGTLWKDRATEHSLSGFLDDTLGRQSYGNHTCRTGGSCLRGASDTLERQSGAGVLGVGD